MPLLHQYSENALQNGGVNGFIFSSQHELLGIFVREEIKGGQNETNTNIERMSCLLVSKVWMELVWFGQGFYDILHPRADLLVLCCYTLPDQTTILPSPRSKAVCGGPARFGSSGFMITFTQNLKNGKTERAFSDTKHVKNVKNGKSIFKYEACEN